MVCSKCGAICTEESNYCSACGQQLYCSNIKIPHYLVWSIISMIFFCLPLGIVALVYSNRTKNYLIINDIEKAKSCSHISKIWNIFATILGVIMITIYLFSMLYNVFLK